MSLEDQQHDAEICIACGDGKSKGLTVCWRCFKYRDNAWKYSELSFEDWLAEIREESELNYV